MPTHIRQRKALRGVLSATYATLVALAGHLAAGGELSSGWLGLFLTLALSTLVCTLLAGNQRSLLRLSLSVVASQWIFHTIFAAHPVALTLEAHSHHASTHLMHIASTSHGMDSSMVLGHLIAAVLTIVGFQHTEKICEGIAHLAALVISYVLPILVAIFPLPTPQKHDRGRRNETFLPLGVLHAPLLVRGPPLSLLSSELH